MKILSVLMMIDVASLSFFVIVYSWRLLKQSLELNVYSTLEDDDKKDFFFYIEARDRFIGKALVFLLFKCTFQIHAIKYEKNEIISLYI